MKTNLSRREFLKVVGGTAGTLAAGGAAGGVILKADRPLSIEPAWFEGEVKTIPSVCHMCEWRCGIRVQVADGRAVRILGNPLDPESRGKTCARGQAGLMDLYSPDRIQQPLIREGERGEGEFRPAAWEEALDYAAEGLLKVRDQWDGAEAIAWFGHHGGEHWFLRYLPGAMGSPNAGTPAEAMCWSPRQRAAGLTFGREFANHEPVDWDETEYVVLIGNHYGENSHVTHMVGLTQALARGAGLVVVDPRRSTAASKAKHWLQIKPGTDTALLLAWLHVLITEELYDRDYVAEWTDGFDELSEHVQSFTPEWAAEITELSAETIRQVAREMADYSPRVAIPPSRHSAWYGNDTQRLRAMYLVSVLLGSVGRPGGLFLDTPAIIREFKHPRLPLEPPAGG